MAITQGMDFTRALCDVLGIDWRSENVTGIMIDSGVNDAVRVIVSRILTGDQAEGALEVIRRYRLESGGLVEESD